MGFRRNKPNTISILGEEVEDNTYMGAHLDNTQTENATLRGSKRRNCTSWTVLLGQM